MVIEFMSLYQIRLTGQNLPKIKPENVLMRLKTELMRLYPYLEITVT